ncbi:MAG TPA: hypothetical protein VI488_13130 [Candidatus Angelobacter sp.]
MAFNLLVVLMRLSGMVLDLVSEHARLGRGNIAITAIFAMGVTLLLSGRVRRHFLRGDEPAEIA